MALLQEMHGLHSSYAQAAAQAAREAGAALGTAYAALTASMRANTEQLEALTAHQQQSAQAALASARGIASAATRYGPCAACCLSLPVNVDVPLSLRTAGGW